MTTLGSTPESAILLLSQIGEYHAMNCDSDDIFLLVCYVIVFADLHKICRDLHGQSFRVGKMLQSPLFLP
jgi:hypothetical protein